LRAKPAILQIPVPGSLACLFACCGHSASDFTVVETQLQVLVERKLGGSFDQFISLCPDDRVSSCENLERRHRIEAARGDGQTAGLQSHESLLSVIKP